MEHGHYHWNCKLWTSNSSNITQSHDKSKDNNSSNFKRLWREHFFVRANSWHLQTTKVPWSVSAVIIDYALLNLFIAQWNWILFLLKEFVITWSSLQIFITISKQCIFAFNIHISADYLLLNLFNTKWNWILFQFQELVFKNLSSHQIFITISKQCICVFIIHISTDYLLLNLFITQWNWILFLFQELVVINRSSLQIFIIISKQMRCSFIINVSNIY